MVRDDFWLAASRFMRDLEIRVVEGDNSALVDLFDPRHAKKVLMAFGRAYGALPETGDLNNDQNSFLDQSTSGLVQDGKIIPVRLALFAEMVKGKLWTPTTLSAVGGTQGIGMAFLEETFSASTAPPEHRLHQKAAQAVLKALMPETGTDIKGQMRSRQQLLEASGYVNRPSDFDDLIHILDPELRLITPTDPDGVASDEWRVAGENEGVAGGALARGGRKRAGGGSGQFNSQAELRTTNAVPKTDRQAPRTTETAIGATTHAPVTHHPPRTTHPRGRKH